MEELLKLMREKLGADVITEDLASDLQSSFEVAINEKVIEKVEAAKEELEEKNSEEMTTFKESLVESIDSYIEYAADEYLKENKVAMDSNLKIEAAGKIIESLQTVLAESGLEIPEDKVDKVAELEEKFTAIQDKLDGAINEGIESKKQIFIFEQVVDFMKKTAQIAESKVSDIQDLMEGLEYKDMEDFNKKLDIVISKITSKVITESNDDFENLDDTGDDATSSIDQYLV